MPRPDRLHKNRIAIVGNPNVGKSSLFYGLTRTYALAANVPHTTMQVSRAPLRIEGRDYEVIDTPGILSLDLPAEDGLITRAILLDEHPEIIILCLDSNNLRRSLLLAAQVLELDIPLVICLNFADEARLKGIKINRKRLEGLLGVPVVETVASEGHGVRELHRALPRAALVEAEKAPCPRFIEQALDDLSACFPEAAVPADGILQLLLAGAPGIERHLRSRYGDALVERAAAIAHAVSGRGRKDIAKLLFRERSRWAGRIEGLIVEHAPSGVGRIAHAMGSLSRHPVWGWAILLLVIYCTYLMVGRIGIGLLVPLLEDRLFAPLNACLAAAVPWSALRDFLFGDYGLLTTGFENALGTVLPVLAMFFLILNLLEDSGYIANLCVLTNRAFQPLGLSGKSILPLVLGFGCRTMAVLTTRILESRKERMIAVFLISCATPCAPLLGVSLAILALLPFTATVAVFGVIAGRAVCAGLLLNRLFRTDRTPDFIIEIPPVRLPSLKNLLIKTYYRLKWFTVEAVPLFMIGAVLLFLADKIMVLDLIKKGMEPLVGTVLHLPAAVVDALLLCLLRLEAGAVIVLKLARAGDLDAVQTIVSVIVITGFTPCFANIMAIAKELGIKTAVWMTAAITAAAFAVGGMVGFMLRM